ncbi:AMP-binding protein [Phaeobacter gallaeciensis]|uniref:3-methylmercaptopropionyl-CoA ligase n=2 Tax=Roseobacteraceae TaxID=2854170 RepID=A0A366WZ06_9RHOB|nr:MULTISPECIES: AMP-binding protein [Roseobacteraceae]MBT3143829.1 AMP-binding protein [Falsiruegeria litorea]MBT8169506.1 AMP-binding protein [Falsiruegeria litorea]RBW53589.1 AMP-binding protein [Phaeobacter gallaeciensis]
MTILNESIASRIQQFGLDQNVGAQNNLAPRDGKSYVQGPKHPELAYATIPQLLRDAVSRYGPRDALVFPDMRLSYYDFDRAVDALASGFLALGLEKGDRLGIWSPNRLEWVLTQFATARIGVVLVNINPAYRLSELEYVLNKVGCKALVLARAFKSSEYLEMTRTLAPELATSERGRLHASKLPHLRHVIVMDESPDEAGIWSFEEVSSLGGPAQQLRLPEIDRTLQPDEAINIQFTSGTTGQPKGATLSHYNIVNNARFVTDRIKLTENDRLAIPVPLYHCFGMVMGVLGAVSKGAAMVFPGEGFDAPSTLAALANERCTALYGVPTMFVAMLQELSKTPRDLTALRTGVMAGAPCPVDVMKQVNDQMHMNEVTICYGMTETAPVSFQSFVDDTTQQRCETVGRVHPHLEVKIINEAGEIVPVGVQGELCTRGYSVMKGYWQDPTRTNEAIRDGWMHTGDLAVLDADGFCTVTGRVKDMIIRGGENIYPREIEEFLFSHPDVSEAQVFGVPDPRLGEEVCAWIVPKPGSVLSDSALRSFCEGQIAHFKVPRYIRIVEDLPMTITGKPQKFIMRDRMIEELDGESTV